jgi:hypothetical protein
MESSFLKRTRDAMQQSLQSVDKLTHFLWASVVLASYYAHSARWVEASTTIATCARFGMACGLPGFVSPDAEHTVLPLLCDPSTAAQYEDRMLYVCYPYGRQIMN